MTGNIEKLTLIAPLLAGRGIYVNGEEQGDVYDLFGLFHSLEIDDAYPNSEPVIYFRATDVKKKRSALTTDMMWEETWETIGDAELAFPISKLENIEQTRGGLLIMIHFFPRGTKEETTLCFS